MKVLVNASTLVVGGGIQVGVSFIQQAVKYKEFEWFFLVSKGIFMGLSDELKNNYKIVLFETSPAKLYKGIKSRREIKNIEKGFAPDLVYSIGFPSYVRFRNIEIGRFTNPWEINPEPLPWHLIPGLPNKIYTKLAIQYRLFWAKRVDYLETQTEAAKIGIAKRVVFPLNKIFVVPNSANEVFIEAGSKIIDEFDIFERENIAFSLSAPYEHKNLDLIPYVAQILKKDFSIDMKFILTLPHDSLLWNKISILSRNLGVENQVQNIGTLTMEQCMDQYKESKIVFLPTLLEVFSATYLEAMAMKVPIVTTDLEFAHDNCKNAAIYFRPSDAEDAALQISKLIKNRAEFDNQIKQGSLVLKSYPNAEEKYTKLFTYFKEIVENGK